MAYCFSASESIGAENKKDDAEDILTTSEDVMDLRYVDGRFSGDLPDSEMIFDDLCGR